MKLFTGRILLLVMFLGTTTIYHAQVRSGAGSETLAAQQKAIDAATPPPLPQTPVAAKLKSDASDEGLKGKVKMVKEEMQDLSGTWRVQGRKPSATTYYNELGNRTKHILYSYLGTPADISVYGYLDGFRVVHTGFIHDAATGPIGPASERSDSPYDDRYSFRFQYKYASNGSLEETRWVSSNGDPWLRYVYQRKGDELERFVYDREGKLNQRYVDKLDRTGNEIEQTTFDVRDNSIKTKYRFTYKFDRLGNWTQMTVSKMEVHRGETAFSSAWIEYRTLAYY